MLCMSFARPSTDVVADFPQRRTGGRTETAQQPIISEPLYPALPALAATIQPLEDRGQLRGDLDLSMSRYAG
jgi:hypothetical protein